MHDLDRNLLEVEPEYDIEPEFEAAGDGFELEMLDEDEDQEQTAGELYGEAVFDEVEEMELASNLLEVTSEDELENFFGKLIARAARGVRGMAHSPVGRALGGVLKQVTKTALPLTGAAVGSVLLPGAGTVLGRKLGSTAGRMFGLELEGMSGEDQEFEVARRLVRLGADAAHEAAETPHAAPPAHVARNAVLAAARRHAPGLGRVIAHAVRDEGPHPAH